MYKGHMESQRQVKSRVGGGMGGVGREMEWGKWELLYLNNNKKKHES